MRRVGVTNIGYVNNLKRSALNDTDLESWTTVSASGN